MTDTKTPDSIQADNAIMADAANHVGATLAELISYDKRPETVILRNKAMLFVRNTGRSYPCVGAMFGRDHSTVMHDVKQAMEAKA